MICLHLTNMSALQGHLEFLFKVSVKMNHRRMYLSHLICSRRENKLTDCIVYIQVGKYQQQEKEFGHERCLIIIDILFFDVSKGPDGKKIWSLNKIGLAY